MNRNHYKCMIDAVYEAGLLLNTVKDTGVFASGILSILREYIGMRRGVVMLHDDDSGALKPYKGLGFSEEVYKNLLYMPGEGFVGKAFKFDMPIIIPEVQKNEIRLDKLTQDEREGSLSFLAIPIKATDKSYGVLAIDRNAAEFQSYDTDTNVIKMLAGYIALFLQRKEAEQGKQRGSAVVSGKGAEVKYDYSFEDIMGNSGEFTHIYEKLKSFGKDLRPVLIKSDKGAGAEIAAYEIYKNMPGAEGSFGSVDIRTLNDAPINVLFGSVGVNGKKDTGLIEHNMGGVLFINGISDMDKESQLALLKYLETGEFRLANAILTPGTRIIANVSYDIDEKISDGRFLPELYYRLNVLSVYIPSLSERAQDIPAIAGEVLKKISSKEETEYLLSPEAAGVLTKCGMPGGLGALESCLEKAVFNCKGKTLKARHFECFAEKCWLSGDGHAPNLVNKPSSLQEEKQELMMFAGEEKGDEKVIIQALKKTGWVQAKAARLLGMTTRQINYRIKKYGIKVNKI